VGLLAAGLLAFSPYFLGFSRTALTEGDAFCPLTVLLTLLAFHWYLCRRDTRSVFVFATALGIALATKFYTILLVPALFICDLLQSRFESAVKAGGKRTFPAEHRSLVFWSIATLMFPLTGMAITQLEVPFLAALFWFGGLSTFLLCVPRYLLKWGRKAADPVPWPAPRAWLAVLPLAAAVCLVVCPEHVVQPEVARALLRRLIRQDHVLPMSPFVDPVRLYSGIVLLKLGLPLGLLTVAALVWAWFRSPREPVLRVLLAVVGLYVLLLTTLPLRQPFYLMSVYPLLTLMLAAFVVRVGLWLRERDRLRLRAVWWAVVVTSCLYLGWGMFRVYPDFGLYGHETVGDRWLGAESRGYRNLIQVTNDGTEDALRWCLEHVPPGQRVVSYLWDDHVIDAFVDRTPPAFELVRRLAEADATRGPSIEDADFLLVGLNNEVTYRDMPSPGALVDRFEPQPVHVVWRGRKHYRMPVVQIYQRRAGDSTPRIN